MLFLSDTTLSKFKLTGDVVVQQKSGRNKTKIKIITSLPNDDM